MAQRVSGKALFLEGVEDPTDGVVHRHDHLAVGALGVGGRAPGRELAADGAVRRVAWTLVRVVRSVVREIEEERFAPVLVDEPLRMSADQVGQVAVFVLETLAVPPVRAAHPIDVRVVVDVAAHETPELVETVQRRFELRQVTEVPLAEHRGPVAELAEALGDRVGLGVDALVVERTVRVGEQHGGNPGPVLVAARDQAGAGRRADRAAGVEVGQHHAARGKPVQVRRLYPAIERADIAVAEIVRHDEDDVGRLAGSGR